MSPLFYFTVTMLGVLVAFLCGPLKHGAEVLGVFRSLKPWENLHGLENRIIPDTIACEDLGYHPEAGNVNPEKAGQGMIVVVDPKTLQSEKLSLNNFESVFTTHSISLYTPALDPSTVYIFAINHLPNPQWVAGSGEARDIAQAEVFTHKNDRK
ncbi:hypothetical protein F5Y16DRAFT_405053 [Xylariaceae sp. FL0255]|nr:hypothetical protein F5Y16DRAFT_405053 [Xylariaceae sp. FL0255]